MSLNMMLIFYFLILFFACRVKKQESSCLDSYSPSAIPLVAESSNEQVFFITGHLEVNLEADAINFLPSPENIANLHENSSASLQSLRERPDIKTSCTAALELTENEEDFPVKLWTARHCFYPRAVKEAQFVTIYDNRILKFPIDFLYRNKILSLEKKLLAANMYELDILLRSNFFMNILGRPTADQFSQFASKHFRLAGADIGDLVNESLFWENSLLNGQSFFDLKKESSVGFNLNYSARTSGLVFLWEDLAAFNGSVNKLSLDTETKNALTFFSQNQNTQRHNIKNAEPMVFKAIEIQDQVTSTVSEQLDLVRSLMGITILMKNCDETSFESHSCDSLKDLPNEFSSILLAEYEILRQMIPFDIYPALSSDAWEGMGQILAEMDQSLFNQRALFWAQIFSLLSPKAVDSDFSLHLSLLDDRNSNFQLINATTNLGEIGIRSQKNILINMPYGLVHIFDEDLVDFEPGNSGTLLTYKDMVPVAVLSFKDGISVSGGSIRTPAPPYIEPVTSTSIGEPSSPHSEESDSISAKTQTKEVPITTAPNLTTESQLPLAPRINDLGKNPRSAAFQSSPGTVCTP